MRRVAAVLGAAVVAAVVAVGPHAAAQEGPPTGPSIALDRGAAATGEVVTVRGDGWPVDVLVTMRVCGDDAHRGAADCDDTASVAARADASGSFSAPLPVVAPPSPCPCVVRATSTVSLDGGVVAPIEVSGAGRRTATGPAVVRRSVSVVDVELRGGGWHAALAWPHHRRLRFTVYNDGNVAVVDPPLAVSARVGGGGPEIVRVVPLGRVEPGERRTVTAAVPVAMGAWGDVVADVEAAGFDRRVWGRARSTGRPWSALVLLGVLGAGTVATGVRRRRRRQVEPSTGTSTRASMGLAVGDPPVRVVDGRDDDRVVIDLRELASAWGPYGPPEPDDVATALRRTLAADLAPLYGLNPDDPADEPYVRAMVDRAASRTMAYLRDPVTNEVRN